MRIIIHHEPVAEDNILALRAALKAIERGPPLDDPFGVTISTFSPDHHYAVKWNMQSVTVRRIGLDEPIMIPLEVGRDLNEEWAAEFRAFPYSLKAQKL